MNYKQCVDEYGEVIADYIAMRIEEDYGRNGLDGFYEVDNNIFEVELVDSYVEEYFNQ